MNGKNYRFVSFFAFLLMAGLLISGGCARKEKVVAKVGNLVITEDEFKQGFIRRYRSDVNASKQSFKERVDFLNTQIDMKLKLADAYRKGLDKKAEVVEAGEEASEKIAVQQILFEKEIIGKIITEEALLEYYNQLGEEINARHILVKANPLDTLEAKHAKDKADSIYQLLQAGEDFAELAKENSDDKSNADMGGDLGYFSWGRMVEEFQQVAFALKKGEISEPVQTPFGYHIIELLDRRKLDRKPFDEEKDNLNEQLRRQKWAEIREAADKYLENLKAEKGLVCFNDSLKVVFEKVDSSDTPQNVSLFADFTEEDRKIVVAEWSGGEVTVADMDELVGGQGAGRFKKPDDFMDVVDAIVIPDLLTERAKELGAYNDPQAVKVGKEAMEAKMLLEIEKLEVEDKINTDDQTLMDFYQNNLDKYMTSYMVTITEILIDDKEKAQELLERGRSGENFQKLAKKYTQRGAAKKTGGKLGPFGKNRYGQVGRQALKLEVGEFCKNPIRMGRNYSVFKVEEKFPASQRLFDKCRKEVERDYLLEFKQRYKENWLASLKEEIKVKIYEKNLRSAMPFVQEVEPVPPDQDKPKVDLEDKPLDKTEPKVSVEEKKRSKPKPPQPTKKKSE